MEYEVVIIAVITADSHEEAERKYRDWQLDIDSHQLYWYDDDGIQHEVPEEVYRID